MSQRCRVETTTQNGIDIVTIRDGDHYAAVAPALGNNCFKFACGDDVIEPVAFEDFVAKPTSYGIPIMLPFPNRIRDGRFSFGGEDFVIDPPRHGMVRDKAWSVVQTGASDGGAWVTSRLDASEFPDQILRQFPFPFVADVTFGLSGNSLVMVTVVTNTGERSMPLGFGIHPYFRRPANGTVSVPANAFWELESSLPTGVVLDVDEAHDLRGGRSLGGLELDDLYTELSADEDGLVHCVIKDFDTRASTIVEFDPTEFPNTIVFTAPSPRRAICVEPQTCPTDAFNLEGRGVDANVIVLPPGESRRFTIRIRG